ncbi:MAG: cation:proton antiporter [Leadbetterella sp.]|nr:cation:proton antiporter [Leadbetterella sp.]
MKKNLLFYSGVTAFFSLIIYGILNAGKSLEQGRLIRDVKAEDSLLDILMFNLHHPLAVLLSQMAVIVLVAKLFGFLCKKIGQPSVVGEMIAGILLGPSLFGLYFPDVSAALFPPSSLENVQLLSQVGLVLYMFIVGLELDLGALKNSTDQAVVISHASILVPFALGVGLSYFLYERFALEGVNFLSFALFMGVAMSITAFPVLARIVQEKGIYKTRLGTMVITCAAVDDITAWCILAAVIAIAKAGSMTSTLYIIGLAVIYVVIMMRVVRPFLQKWLLNKGKGVTKRKIAVIFLTVVLSAYTTEVIGIHALFGAFLAGIIMPDDFRQLLVNKVEDLTVVLFLPLFFAFTGLRTHITGLSDPEMYVTLFLIVLVAVAGKFLGSALAARFVGQDWKTSLSIGVLMNTRGLMELVVLNIGYDLGVLSPEIFAMMVFMALITTFMTGPLLSLIDKTVR